jgi:hypothetical protein
MFLLLQNKVTIAISRILYFGQALKKKRKPRQTRLMPQP